MSLSDFETRAGSRCRSPLPSRLYLLSRKSLSSIPAFLIRFSRRVFPVTDEAVGSDVALVWCGASALEWVLAWL